MDQQAHSLWHVLLQTQLGTMGTIPLPMLRAAAAAAAAVAPPLFPAAAAAAAAAAAPPWPAVSKLNQHNGSISMIAAGKH